MADFHFAFNRGSYGYEFDWEGEKVIIKAIGASKAAVNECMAIAVEHARANHPEYPPPGDPDGRFANRTEQMVDAITILQDAEVSWDIRPRYFAGFGGSLGPSPWVHGEWGVQDRPVVQDPDIWSGRWPGMQPKFRTPVEGQVNATTMDRAMWLEFGTVRMAPRPFLYPAWDEAKIQLGRLVAEAMLGMRGGRPGGFAFR